MCFTISNSSVAHTHRLPIQQIFFKSWTPSKYKFFLLKQEQRQYDKPARREPHAVGTVPPSMMYSVPVMEAARGEATNAIRSATSLGLAGRPSGIPPSPFMMIRFPYVDGPLLARLFGQSSDQIACVHMSGLFSRSHMNAGQDGFRDASSKHPSDLWRPVESTECLASWIDRPHHLLVALQVLASAQHGCS